MCLIPLANRGRVLGILGPSRTTETAFVPEDVDFLSQASGQIAIAIENALAYHEISDSRTSLHRKNSTWKRKFAVTAGSSGSLEKAPR